MKSWPSPAVPTVPGTPLPVRVHDTATSGLVTLDPGPVARLYVCGITPYDATHMGHAATYVTFDLLGRALRQAGHEVRYAQNITDVDDPLLERAHRDGVDWTALATKEIQLFRDDMTALRVIAPDDYVGVVESVELIADRVAELVASGEAYGIPVVGDDVAHEGALDYYLDLTQVPSFGEVSHWSSEQMMGVFADRGGDPDRPGKRSPFDPLLWRAERTGEPAWAAGDLGCGRPGWHIECTAIALDRLGEAFDVQGGGSDLIFPHHEMSAAQTRALAHAPFAKVYMHQGMVGLDGEKMSKSKGNLVLVSKLRADDVDPMAVRLVLLDQHYRTDWEWAQDLLDRALERLATWRAALAAPGADPEPVLDELREALVDDLDSPRALAAVDSWAARSAVGEDGHPDAGARIAEALDAWYGIAL